MQNYDGKFKLNGQEYFYRAKDDSGSSKITRVNNEEHHYRMVESKIDKCKVNVFFVEEPESHMLKLKK